MLFFEFVLYVLHGMFYDKVSCHTSLGAAAIVILKPLKQNEVINYINIFTNNSGVGSSDYSYVVRNAKPIFLHVFGAPSLGRYFVTLNHECFTTEFYILYINISILYSILFYTNQHNIQQCLHLPTMP